MNTFLHLIVHTKFYRGCFLLKKICNDKLRTSAQLYQMLLIINIPVIASATFALCIANLGFLMSYCVRGTTLNTMISYSVVPTVEAVSAFLNKEKLKRSD